MLPRVAVLGHFRPASPNTTTQGTAGPLYEGMRAAAGHADHDSFVAKAHSEKLHAAYAGDKNLITFEGDHNSHRPAFFYNSVLFFLKAVLQLDNDITPGDAAETAAAEAGCAAALLSLFFSMPEIAHKQPRQLPAPVLLQQHALLPEGCSTTG